jgi:choline dehydrogenase-like flavoprotein
VKTMADFIICGGGIAGCVLASRLSEKYPSSSILLIEAGENVSQHPAIIDPNAAPLLVGTELDWSYQTVPQTHLNNKVCQASAGKALSGGSAINAGS